MKRVAGSLMTAIALVVALTLSLGLATGAGAQGTPEATITIGSASLEGGEVVVRGTVTCTEAVTGSFSVQVHQSAPGGEVTAGFSDDLECTPGAGNPYEATFPRDGNFGGELGGGPVRVDVDYVYACRDPEVGDCREARASGTFTVEGPPPVGIASKSVVLTLYGTPGPDDAGKTFVTQVVGGNGVGHCTLEADGSDPCEGNGTQYRYDNIAEVTRGSRIEVEFTWERYPPGLAVPDVHTFYQVTEVLKGNMTNYAWYDFDTDTGGGGKGPGAGQDTQQGGDVQDDQQAGTGEDKDTGTGEDQQGTGARAGKTPDNQQGGGGETVTKTFELTLNGDVPEGETFYVVYAETDREAAEGTFLIFCGDAELINSEPSDVDCVGDGTVYTQEIQVPAGTEIFFSFGHVPDEGEGEGFHEGTETIDEDMTNSAFFTFGKDTGAGDDQQDDDKDTGTGAGDEQEIPDNQQDDTGDDVQDDQQGEMPEELPDTGAGGLATGASVPWGSLGLAASGLLAAGYAVLRRR